MKKYIILFVICFSILIPNLKANATENKQAVSSQLPFKVLSADEMVSEMGTGWNLGNTMDGHTGFTPNETLWQNVETTQEFIKVLHDTGFNNIRIPITWGTMIDDSNDYKIDEKWMSRVQDIVDYAIHMNMYVMINVHHDGAEQMGWLRIASDDFDFVKEKYEAVWKQIAECFKDYDEHLIFESMNEVTGSGTTAKEDTEKIMELNQIFVEVVRATGSNNEERWLSVPGRYTNIGHSTDPNVGFELPKDGTKNRLFVAVHYYDWQFGLLENKNQTTFSYDTAKNLAYDFAKLKEKFTSKGIPVILGEYGAINKGNTIDRAYHMEIVNRLCQINGVVPVYWDQGWYDLNADPDYSFTLIDRDTCEEIFPDIIDAILRGTYFSGAEDLTDIIIEPKISPIMNMDHYIETIYTQVGNVTEVSLIGIVDKKNSKDTIVWKSNNESVATVNATNLDLDNWTANIHATGIGVTTIIASSRSGGAQIEIPIIVTAATTEVSCEEIVVTQESYELLEDQFIYLNTSILPTNTDAHLTYYSTNTDIITVSKIGKVVAKNKGEAMIIVSSSDGISKTIPISVVEGEVKAEIALALNVYYNDDITSYFSNESGNAIVVSEDGTYTLSFDCDKDLSQNAIASGVSSLSNLTAIYIKDDSVTKGTHKKSPLLSCDIVYDKIKIDGTDFEVMKKESKSALKASGILDTNDPINSWDGSVIEEVNVKNHVLNFTNIEEPKKIEITFTLSNLVFEDGAVAIEKDKAESIEMIKETSLLVTEENPLLLSVKVSPLDCGKVVFVSDLPSVVYVDSSAIETNEEGVATVTVYALSNGEATITAYTENNLSCEFLVKAELSEKEESNNTTYTMLLFIIAMLLLGGGIFFLTIKVINKK